MSLLKEAIVRHAAEHANGDGVALTPLPGVRVMCCHQAGATLRSIYKPLVCLVLQGAKQMTIGRDMRQFSAGDSVIVGLDLPVAGRIAEATLAEPYVAIAVELDMPLLLEMGGEVPLPDDADDSVPSGVFLQEADAAVLDCARRLMQLVGHPSARPVLLPSILRELHYWLIAGPHGESLRRLALPQGQAQRIALAVQLLRTSYREPIAVQQLAQAARMSVSSLHRQFKAVTTLTPVQFQKHLRLVEARRLMMSDGMAAGQAAFEVGYESASQFNREYARLFGAPPRRDVRSSAARASQPRAS